MSNPFSKTLGVSKLFPKLNTLPNMPASCYVLRFLCLLGPIVRAVFIVTFAGKFFLLTHSYLTKNERPSGKVTRCDVTCRLNNILFLYISSASTPSTAKKFFITTRPNEPNMGAASAPMGKNPPFCLHLFRLPPIFHAPHLSSCFFILKSWRLFVQCYMFCDVKLALAVITRTSTGQANMPKSLTLVFW